MTIKVGDKFPSVMLKRLGTGGMEDVNTDDVMRGKKVVLFSVPGAFTPTCSAKHLPGFVNHAGDFKSKGYEIVCMAVNDPFVMNAWAKANNAESIAMLPDGNGALTRALGLEMDGTGYGLGQRSQRFAMLVDNGVVKALNVEAPGKFEVSSAEAMLKAV
ncbi:MAG TPA: peroxiredoxin [Alphaproteobacteria bacterium]|nr:peroxiredoxin [Alphaproteobacteria bacterium]